jgi:transcriptional regulator with XRE-family HTH domain
LFRSEGSPILTSRAAQLGALIGVSNNRVSNWEQGLNRPDADILAALCVALQIPPSELLGVRLSTDDLCAHERKLIRAYRVRGDMRPAVDVLLGL